MKPPFPSQSLTKEWHNAPYAAIDPSQQALSHAGKTVVISGGGSGIGRAIAIAYGIAGAGHIVITGRREAKLQETKELIRLKNPSAEVTVSVGSTTDRESVSALAKQVGRWDVLVINAGKAIPSTLLGDADFEDWWSSIEVNIKGTFAMIHSFLPTRNENAAIVAVSAALMAEPMKNCVGHSDYLTSKIAQARLLAQVAEEYPDICPLIIHPGIVETGLQERGGWKPPPVLIDQPDLAGHFIVWATSPEGRFLRGRYVSCNWDVDELKARSKEIQETRYLNATLPLWSLMQEQI